MIKQIIQKYRWRHLAKPLEQELLAVIDTWIGTPYMAGQRAKGQGVDCVQFVGGMLDDLYRSAIPSYIPRLPQNSGMHYPRAGFRTALSLRKQFRSSVVRDGCIEPGDVIVTRGIMDVATPRLMGHTLIAGAIPWTFVHSINVIGVCWTSLQGVPGIIRIYRPVDKETWI